MTYEKEIKLKGAILTQEKLLKLMKILEEFIPDVSISIDYKDNTKNSAISVKEFENMSFQNKHVKSIEVSGGAANASVWLSQFILSENYEIRIHSNKYENYVSLCDKIENWIVEISDRKNWIDFLNGWLIIILFIILNIGLLQFVDFTSKDILAYIMSTLFCSLGISMMIRTLIKYAYPLTELDMGVNRHKQLRKFVWGIVSLIIIPIVLTLIF